MDWHLSKRVTDQQGKDRAYWIDEIAFLEARLNGSQGDIDSEDRAACEEALKQRKRTWLPLGEPGADGGPSHN